MQFIDFSVVGGAEATLRIVLSAAFGLAIGLDRDLKNKPIDFRAYMIIAAISCMVAIMAQELHGEYDQADNGITFDFTRIVQGILTGIGFLGAGAIIHRPDGARVIGTATGASIWAAGGLGLTLGFGFYGLAAIGFIAVFATLFVLGFFLPAITDQSDKIDHSDPD